LRRKGTDMVPAFIFVGAIVALVAALRMLRRPGLGFATYRPEQHYMRGPGPKWRAKHVAGHGRS
jgi:hypothetical protein